MLWGLVLVFLLAGCAAGRETQEAVPAGDPVSSALEETPAGSEEEETAGTGEIRYDEGTEPLSEEQEKTIYAYMDRAYAALAALETPDFSGLFADAVQQQASESGVALKVGMRTLSSDLDYSLTAYHYTLQCSNVTRREDGAVEVGAMETSTQTFAQLPEVDALRSRIFHRFVLVEGEDGWLLQSHMQYDTLYGQFMSGGNWMGGFAAEYVAAMPEYLASFQTAQAQREGQRGETAELPLADVAYDRDAAVAYSDQYAMERNEDWADYTGSGGNCQNFASQCLLAGDIPMDTVGDAVWKWYDDNYSDSNTAEGRSGSWTSVSRFLQYAQDNTGYGLVALTDAPYYTGQPGDLIQMGADGTVRHTVVICEVITDEAGNTVDYLVNSNTNDLQNYPASLYGYPELTLTRIVGWNQN